MSQNAKQQKSHYNNKDEKLKINVGGIDIF